jgi:hypothetical protein
MRISNCQEFCVEVYSYLGLALEDGAQQAKQKGVAVAKATVGFGIAAGVAFLANPLIPVAIGGILAIDGLRKLF